MPKAIGLHYSERQDFHTLDCFCPNCSPCLWHVIMNPSCDMTHWYTWYICAMTVWYMCNNVSTSIFLYRSRSLCSTCSLQHTCVCVTHVCVCDMTWSIAHSCVWNDMMNHSCMWHDSFVHVTWQFRICDMALSYMWHGNFVYVTWLFRICDMTLLYKRPGSFVYATRLFH